MMRFTSNQGLNVVMTTITDLHIEGRYVKGELDTSECSKGKLSIKYEYIDESGKRVKVVHQLPQKVVDKLPLEDWVSVGGYLNTLNYTPSPKIVNSRSIRVTGHEGIDRLLNELLEKEIDGELNNCYVYNRGSEEKPEWAIFYEYVDNSMGYDIDPYTGKCTNKYPRKSGNYWCHDYNNIVEEFIERTMHLDVNVHESYDALKDFKKGGN